MKVAWRNQYQAIRLAALSIGGGNQQTAKIMAAALSSIWRRS